MIFVENNSFDMIFMIVFFIIAGTFLFYDCQRNIQVAS